MIERNDVERCPADVLDWIAWYPEGEVPDGVRGTIESHAAECLACRQEIGLVRGEGAAVADLPATDRVFARILTRIEEAGADVGTTEVPVVDPATARRPAPRRVRRGLGLRGAVAAGLVLMLASALGGFAVATSLGKPVVYETVSEAAAPPVAGGILLDVVFRPEVPFGQIQEALRRIDASVVAGPSRAGVVRLRLPEGAPAAAIASQLRAQESGVALFAEPVPER